VRILQQKRCKEYRTLNNDPQTDEKIQFEYRKLMQGVEMWKQRPIIQKQEELNNMRRQISKLPDNPSLRFLRHEPLHLKNIYYAKLQNQMRMLTIWNFLIVLPETGPKPFSYGRYFLAVDICRTHAATGRDAYISPSWQSLFYAGLVFGGRKTVPIGD
jgi:hypothetical protein